MKRVLKFISRIIGFCLALIGLLMGAFLFMILCLGILGFIISPKTDVGVIKANWGIELPYGYKTVEKILVELKAEEYLTLFDQDYYYFYLLGDDEMSDLYIIWILETNEVAVVEEII